MFRQKNNGVFQPVLESLANRATFLCRHTCKDRCRNADIPQDFCDFTTGHSGGDSASDYGECHPLTRRKEALDKAQHLISIIARKFRKLNHVA